MSGLTAEEQAELDALRAEFGVDEGFSTAPPPQKELSNSQYAAGLLGSALKGLPLIGSSMDEIGAGIDSLGAGIGTAVAAPFRDDISLSDISGNMAGEYDKSLGIRRGVNRDFEEAHPYQALGTELASSLISGGVALKAGGVGTKLAGEKLLPRVLAGGLIGGTEGAVQGFGAGEEGIGNRLDSALWGGSAGAVLGGGTELFDPLASALSRKSESLGRGAQQSSLGITANDIARGARGPGGYYRTATGENPVIRAFERVRKKGTFKETMTPAELVNIADESAGKLEGKLLTQLKKADRARGRQDILPSFKNALDYVDRQAGTFKEQMKKALDEEFDALTSQLDGSFEQLQKAKIAFNKRNWVGRSLDKEDLGRAITQDLKEAIENGIDELALTGKISAENQGIVREINQEIGDWLTLKPVFARGEARELAGDPSKRIIATMRTTGGFGVPMIVANQFTSNPLISALTGATGGMLTSNRGRYATGSALRGVSSGIEGARGLLSRLPISSENLSRTATRQFAQRNAETKGEEVKREPRYIIE